jgi:hypothetical protein
MTFFGSVLTQPTGQDGKAAEPFRKWSKCCSSREANTTKRLLRETASSYNICLTPKGVTFLKRQQGARDLACKELGLQGVWPARGLACKEPGSTEAPGRRLAKAEVNSQKRKCDASLAAHFLYSFLNIQNSRP